MGRGQRHGIGLDRLSDRGPGAIWATATLLMRSLSGLYRMPILFLGLSAVVGAGFDAAFAYTAVLRTYASGGLIDVGWLAVSLLSLWAATFQSVAPLVEAQEGEGLEIGPEERSSWRSLPRFLLPYVSLASLIGLEAASWSSTASETFVPVASDGLYDQGVQPHVI